MDRISKELHSLIRSGTRLIQLVSYETLRVHAFVNEVSIELQRDWYVWDCISGLRKREGKGLIAEHEDYRGPETFLDHLLSEELSEKQSNGIYIAEDFHPFMGNDDPRMVRRLRNISKKEDGPVLILCVPFQTIPPELEKEIAVLDIPLPHHDELETIFGKVVRDFELPTPKNKNRLIDSALGLTIMEARQAFSKAAVEHKSLSDTEIPFVIAEKESIIRKSGFLEYYHPDTSMEDIGGLDILKSWLKKRGRAFHPDARDYGLESPRGILLLGIPGTGKSLAAKAIGNSWELPLLKLDMGRVFGGIVGESERNIRTALKIAEALAPSILWVDEIEKGLSGMQSSGSTDGGTTARVLGSFLNWMQEREKPVFVVATANDIGQLPPELLRKGRVDEIFFVDLPSQSERKDIFKIHLRKRKRDPKRFDLDKLAESSVGFSGAEIEEAIKGAMFLAFDEPAEVTTDHIDASIRRTYPLSKTMKETITSLRKWAKARAVLASSERPDLTDDEKSSDRDEVPKLKQERYSNPFI